MKLNFGKNRKIRNAPPVVEEEAVTKQDTVEKELTLVWQKLASEEANLIEQKKTLASLREKLRLKIQEEIKGKQDSIKKLKAEITDLKNVEEEPTVIWQQLTSLEANLIEEKKNLTYLAEKLRLRQQKKIEGKQESIKKLRVEIEDLKFTCGELSKSLNACAQMPETD